LGEGVGDEGKEFQKCPEYCQIILDPVMESYHPGIIGRDKNGMSAAHPIFEQIPLWN
jgi:hypothetical protein